MTVGSVDLADIQQTLSEMQNASQNGVPTSSAAEDGAFASSLAQATSDLSDADGMSDVDYTGMQALRDMAVEFEGRGVSVGIARASHLVHHNLKHGALLAQLGSDHLFASVEEAVAALQPGP